MDAVSTRYRDNNPSFSSTLLDEIYRSIDQQSTICRKTKKPMKFGGDFDEQSTICRKTKKPTKFGGDFDERSGCLIQKWMEDEKPVIGRKSAAADLDRRSIGSLYFNSSSSSGGGLSSSEGELLYGVLFKPKPIRTKINENGGFVKREKEKSSYGGHGYNYNYHDLEIEQKIKHESKFVKTKSKAMKIYSDLKKVKQPISPGGRLSSFLNSLFTTGNNKKSKTSAAAAAGDGNCTGTAKSNFDRKSKSANASTCSTASSFSRSCLSKTPSSRGKLNNNGSKRSVRFYPVSEIVDEYCQPCGHKSLHEEEEEEMSSNSMNEEFEIKQAARNLLKNYQKKKVEMDFDLKRNNDEDGDGFDDGKSDSSSDLFELDNLSPIGMGKYRQELPVYETTHLDTNRAIANDMVV